MTCQGRSKALRGAARPFLKAQSCVIAQPLWMPGLRGIYVLLQAFRRDQREVAHVTEFKTDAHHQQDPD